MKVFLTPLFTVMVAGAVAGLSGCTGPAPTGVTAQPAPASTSAPAPATVSATVLATSPPTAGAPGPASATNAVMVTIQNFLFAPAELTVAPGAVVTVVNQDGANHTLTAKDHSFDTGNIPGNATGTFTAPTAPGTYAYDCAIHPFMTGTLTVS